MTCRSTESKLLLEAEIAFLALAQVSGDVRMVDGRTPSTR
jgi:hypothetical protein